MCGGGGGEERKEGGVSDSIGSDEWLVDYIDYFFGWFTFEPWERERNKVSDDQHLSFFLFLTKHTSCKNSQPMSSITLTTLPPELLEHIAFFVCTSPLLGPPLHFSHSSRSISRFTHCWLLNGILICMRVSLRRSLIWSRWWGGGWGLQAEIGNRNGVGLREGVYAGFDETLNSPFHNPLSNPFSRGPLPPLSPTPPTHPCN